MQQEQFNENNYSKHFYLITSARHVKPNKLLGEWRINTSITSQQSIEQKDAEVLKQVQKANHQNQLDNISELYSQCKKWR
jgi:hypothetical protein